MTNPDEKQPTSADLRGAHYGDLFRAPAERERGSAFQRFDAGRCTALTTRRSVSAPDQYELRAVDGGLLLSGGRIEKPWLFETADLDEPIRTVGFLSLLNDGDPVYVLTRLGESFAAEMNQGGK